MPVSFGMIKKNETYLLHPLQNSPHDIGLLLKAEKDKGLRVKSGMWQEIHHRGSAELGTCRQLGDRHSWTMDLNTANVAPSSTPDSILAYATFSFDSDAGTAVCHISSSNMVHCSHAFFGTHTLYVRSCPLNIGVLTDWRRMVTCLKSKRRVPYGAGIARLKQMLDEAMIMQLSMLKLSERPSMFQAISQGQDRVSKTVGKFSISD